MKKRIEHVKSLDAMWNLIYMLDRLSNTNKNNAERALDAEIWTDRYFHAYWNLYY